MKHRRLLRVIGILQHVPWVTGLVHKLSSVPEEQLKFREYGAKCYDKRKQSPGKRDLFYYIVSAPSTVLDLFSYQSVDE